MNRSDQDTTPRIRNSGLDRGRFRWRLLLLLLPVLLGAGIRMNGVHHGKRNMIYHPDVAKQAIVARRIYRGNLDIRGLFNDNYELTLYPQGMAVLTGNAEAVRGWIRRSDRMERVNTWRWALSMRYTGITLFLLSVAATLGTVYRLWGAQAAFWTGLLLVAEPVHAQMSHYGMNDAPLAGLLLLAWSASVQMREEQRWPWFSLLSGLAVGVGFGVKYTGLLGLLFPGIAWLERLRGRSWKASALSAIAVAAGVAAGVWLTCPLLRQDPGYFVQTFPEFMRWQSSIMGVQVPLGRKVWTNLRAMGPLLAQGYALLLAGFVGSLWLAWRRRDRSLDGPLLSAALFSVLFSVLALGARDMFRANDLIPVYLFLALGWGASFSATVSHADRPRRSTAVVRAFGVVLLPGFLWSSIQDGRALSREDTRVLAREWCREHLSQGVSVISERYTLPVGRPDLQESRRRFLWEAAAKSPSAADGRAFKDFDYYLVSSLAYARFYDKGSPYYNPEAQRAYDWIRDSCRKVAEFRDRELMFAHPVITVYRNERPADSPDGKAGKESDAGENDG